MKILLIGATGTIGKAVASALGARHDLVLASKHKSHEQVDISDPASLRALFTRVGRVDAIVNAAGGAAWKPLAELSDEDFAFSFANKLMGHDQRRAHWQRVRERWRLHHVDQWHTLPAAASE
jgi:NAD(P)-dependent dehydrogenase (short-subunit alcohol dehydrogenase family)